VGKEQYLVPYLMSSHPGSRLSDAVNLAEYLKKIGCSPEQVQDYYPTPGTASTVMFYTGLDPLTMKEVYCESDYHGKAMQRALLQFNRPENADIVREALHKCGREDLIGNAPNCLVRPAYQKNRAANGSQKPSERKNTRFDSQKGKKQGNTDRKNNVKDTRKKSPAQGSKPRRKVK